MHLACFQDCGNIPRRRRLFNKYVRSEGFVFIVWVSILYETSAVPVAECLLLRGVVSEIFISVNVVFVRRRSFVVGGGSLRAAEGGSGHWRGRAPTIGLDTSH